MRSRSNSDTVEPHSWRLPTEKQTETTAREIYVTASLQPIIG